MGGGGGSYVAPYDQWVSVLAANPTMKQKFEGNRGKYGSEAEWYAAYGGPDPSPMPLSANMSKDIFTKIYGTYTPPAVAATPTPTATTTTTTPTTTTAVDTGPALATSATGPTIGTGDSITQPTTATSLGSSLGDAVLKPPRYWVGGLDSYDTAGSSQNTGRGSGAQRTTNR